MPVARVKKILAAASVLTVILAAGFVVGTGRLASLMARAGSNGQELVVATRTMSFWVESNGLLRATSVRSFGGPPAFAEYWQFQIVSMVPEGKNVKKDEVLIVFDAQRIRDDLQRFQNDLDQATKELERVRAQTDLERKELEAKLAAAENNHEKLKLKQKTDSVVDTYIDIKVDELALAQAKREVEARREQLNWQGKSTEANYQIIASRRARAENKVNMIRGGIEGFQVKADRDGVAIYKLKWNGERFQVGESVWSGQPILEIPDLNTLIAEGFVPEVDIGKVKVGQTAEVTIDALPGKTYTGKVTGVGTLVRPKAWDIQNRILEAQISLDELDTSIMRPGMSVKVKIETSTLPNCIAVPIKAIRTTSEGSLVKVKTDTGWRERRVTLGDSNGAEVVILDGLQPGERVAVDFIKAQ
jgi:HlyD family secretion protein